MKTRISYLIFIVIALTTCKKRNIRNVPAGKTPTAILVSTSAVLLDTAAFPGKRIMHFKIVMDVTAGDTDIFFHQITPDYHTTLNVLGPDTIYPHTVDPFLFTYLPEVVSESGVFYLRAGDTTEITYVARVIATGEKQHFYMQAYKLPYSSGVNDGTYESVIVFDNHYVTGMPH